MMHHEDPSPLSLKVVGIIVLVTAIWGFNFIMIKIGVAGVPPLFLAACRFLLSAFPALIFVKKPPVSHGKLAAYGLLLGVGEFGLLFTAIKLGAPAGISSIVLQTQAFFTALLAALFLREKIRLTSILGMIIAGTGLALIALHGSGTALYFSWPMAMLVLAAFFWAAANISAQGMKNTGGLSLMVWSSLYSPIPLFALSIIFERENILPALKNLGLPSAGALAYLVLLSTLFGYGVWNQLIMRHGARRVAPFSLLVPIFGVASGYLALGERISPSTALASVLVLSGVTLHVFGGRIMRLLHPFKSGF
jgi:O-acetylserine/cysteine efflux transporter